MLLVMFSQYNQVLKKQFIIEVSYSVEKKPPPVSVILKKLSIIIYRYELHSELSHETIDPIGHLPLL